MATNPSPDIEVLKIPRKRKRNLPGLENVLPPEYKKKSEKLPVESDEEEEAAWESPNNFYYERKYLDL